MMRENSRSDPVEDKENRDERHYSIYKVKNLQALEDAKGTKSERISKDWEIMFEKDGGPTDFSQEQCDDLEDYEQPVHDCPENTSGLIGYGRPSKVSTG